MSRAVVPLALWLALAGPAGADERAAGSRAEPRSDAQADSRADSRGDSRGDARETVWDAVYSEGQARRGAAIYAEPCGKCHGERLNGAPDDPDMFSTPPVAGSKFLRDWSGTTLLGLFDYTRTTMPANNPGYFTEQELADVIAYMLFVSGVPVGPRELPPDRDRLAAVMISVSP